MDEIERLRGKLESRREKLKMFYSRRIDTATMDEDARTAFAFLALRVIVMEFMLENMVGYFELFTRAEKIATLTKIASSVEPEMRVNRMAEYVASFEGSLKDFDEELQPLFGFA